MRIYAAITFGCLIVSQSNLAQPLTMGARIHGQILDESGAPALGSLVRLTRMPLAAGDASGPFPFSMTTPVREKGHFVFTGLAAGRYQICVAVPKSDLLDPCQWGPRPVVTLRPEQILSDLNLTLKHGYRLPIHIDDPQQQLSRHLDKTPGASLLIGIGATTFIPATLTSATATGRDQSILIPFDTDVQVSVYSPFFLLAGEQGLGPANENAKIPVRALKGTTTARLNIRVTGVRSR